MQEVPCSNPTASVSNATSFTSSLLCFEIDLKAIGGFYISQATGSKRSNTRGQYVICYGLTKLC